MSPTAPAARRSVLVALMAAALALSACGSDGGTATAPPADTTSPVPARTATTPPARTTTPAAPAAAKPARPLPAPRPRAPRCPADASNCRAGSGRVIALESVDADGDGDLHLILASDQSITLPGVTVLDINKDLRPRRDPHVGDWAAGAGPVYQGSYGQSQIQVDHVVYAPRR